jgi:hypothetical protein
MRGASGRISKLEEGKISFLEDEPAIIGFYTKHGCFGFHLYCSQLQFRALSRLLFMNALSVPACLSTDYERLMDAVNAGDRERLLLYERSMHPFLQTATAAAPLSPSSPRLEEKWKIWN